MRTKAERVSGVVINVIATTDPGEAIADYFYEREKEPCSESQLERRENSLLLFCASRDIFVYATFPFSFLQEKAAGIQRKGDQNQRETSR